MRRVINSKVDFRFLLASGPARQYGLLDVEILVRFFIDGSKWHWKS